MIRRHLFDDNMEVKEVNKAGQRFDKVSRIEARGSDHGDVKLVLDYNSQVYNLPEGKIKFLKLFSQRNFQRIFFKK